ncbi:MAG: hypothetical protein IPP77_11850 [Bacteroidetes bacterium]|nr:hypothetical protein [Bacteroidota bacterium]
MNPSTIVVLFIFGLLIGYRADRLGRNFLIWMICAMIFTPILTWIALEISGKSDDMKEEEKKNLILKNEPIAEPDTEVITPNGNVFRFVSRKEGDFEESSSTLESVEQTSPHNKEEKQELNSVEEKLTNEAQQLLAVDGKTSKTDATTVPNGKWFNKKTLAVSLNQTQKIIYSISTFLITLVLAYAIAEDIDSEMTISETWGIWIIFILIQAWFQNKLWNSDPNVNFVFYFPRISGLLNPIKSLTNSHNIKKLQIVSPPIIKPDHEKPIQPIKTKKDITTILIYGLCALVLIMIIVAIATSNDKPTENNSTSILKGINEQAQTSEVPENSEATTTAVNRPLTFDNETVSKLLNELENGQVKIYDFKGPSSLGFKFKSTFPESLKYFVKKDAKCQAGLELHDRNGNLLVYSIELNEGHSLDNYSSSQLDEVLDGTLNFQIENIYKKTSKSYEIIDEGRKMFIGNFRAKYFDIFLEHLEDSEIKYSAIRTYIFYFKGGNGQLNFCLRSNNKTQLKKDFSEYETLFQQTANMSELNKEQ